MRNRGTTTCGLPVPTRRAIQLGLITGVASGHKDAPVNKTVAFDSDTLFLNMMSHTNLGINIADSTDIVLNGKPLETKIDVVRFETDDTAAALQAIREKLA